MNEDSHNINPPISNLTRGCLAVALLWALVLACYWKIALAGRALAGGDIFSYFYPYWAEATRAIRAGRLPLWNPYLFMGAPFLANSQVGFLYPPNWPLWLLLPAHRSIHLSIVLHLCLAALNGYLWGRSSLRMGRLGAWALGASFALGGYLGAQVEHVNQLQGLAWLPLMLLLSDKATGRKSRPAIRKPPLVALTLIVSLVFLAGHTQTVFISLLGLAAYALGPALWLGLRRRDWRPLARRAAFLTVVVVVGTSLAAVQLLPTWELSRQSVRAGGLPFKERVSFSLSPFYLTRALLPSFGAPIPPAHIEHVAYVGVAGLALAAIAIFNLHASSPDLRSPLLLLCLGLFLSLGLYNPLYLLLARFVPGFAHFRAPARWLALYALGMAALVGGGVDLLWRRGGVGRRLLWTFALLLVASAAWAVVGVRVGEGGSVAWPTVAGWAAATALALGLLAAARRRQRWAAVSLLALLLVELIAASSALPHSRASAPQAFTSLRPSIAHLLAAQAQQGRGAGARFISMSDITFDPGDLPEIEIAYGPQLSDEALYDYVVAAKHKEVLSPNLPLAFGVPAVDGYDGGVLPLQRYVTLQRLFLPQDAVSIDGRLRENLTAIPDGRWLSLFDVQHVITDKLQDTWLDGVFYDLQFGARLAYGESAAAAQLTQFEATALGLVVAGGERGASSDSASVGEVAVRFADGRTREFDLRPEAYTCQADDRCVARLRWDEPAAPVELSVRASSPERDLIVLGASLIDERTGGFQALVLSDRGRFRLAHSGDVKIYENLDRLGRAFLVAEATVAGDEEALRLMQDAAFDPATEVILAKDSHSPTQGQSDKGNSSRSTAHSGARRATVLSYQPERVEIEVESERPGYLVLTDAWYPGWLATVDGESVPVRRADLLFRAVAVDAGRRRVIFTFRPASLRLGLGVSLVSLIGLIVAALAHARACFVQSQTR